MSACAADAGAPPPAAPARILYLVTDDWYFASHRLPLARAAVAAGYDVTIACRVREHGAQLRAAGCSVVPFEISRSGIAPWTEWRCWHRVALYRERQPDLVHHVALKPVLYGSFAARAAGVPNVVNALAGLGFLASSPSLKARLLRPVVGLALRGALRSERSRLIVQNPDDRAVLLSTGIVQAAQVILMGGVGVALDHFAPASEPPGPPIVLLPARMLWSKGIGIFVDAARTLRHQGVQARFVLAGRADPDNPAAVPVAQLQAWVAAGAIEWWGHREDVADVLRQSAVVCLPSTYGEGVPRGLLEAAATGRPIITTDTPGCRDVVHHDVSGLLVPPGDAAAFAAAVERLLRDPELRARFGAAGRALAVAEFSEERPIRRTLQLYRELLALPT